MPKASNPMTRAELDDIEQRRTEAKARARRLIEAREPAEEARITAAAEADPENPPLTAEDFSRMRPAHELHPDRVANELRRGRGRPKLAAPKRQVTLRLDQDVIEGMRAMGRGWQVRVNAALREWLRRRTDAN